MKRLKRFLIVVAFLPMLIVIPVKAQNQNQNQNQEQAMQQMMAALPNDPAVRVGHLENGLTYYIRHNELPKGRAEFYLATNVGAIQETPDQDGLAHFLEHMCFNGTAHFPDKGLHRRRIRPERERLHGLRGDPVHAQQHPCRAPHRRGHLPDDPVRLRALRQQ